MAASAGIVVCGFMLFALARGHLAEPLTTISVLGFGVGAFSAAMPGVILAVTPAAETASTMSVNQLTRYLGFSIGSAIGAGIVSGGNIWLIGVTAGVSELLALLLDRRFHPDRRA